MEGQSALVVDNDARSCINLSSMLEKLGFSAVSANSAEEALRILETSGIALVLCDWQMSGMNATELCEALRKRSSESYIYFVLLTGSSDSEFISKALKAGADDFMHKPVDPSELGVRLQSAARIIELQRKLTERNAFLEFAYQSVTTDLKIAAKVQEDLLPRQFRLAVLDTNWVFKPANFVAGDMFDYFPLGDDYFVFYILDVEGHGIASALTSFAINNQLNPSSHGLCSRSLKIQKGVPEAVVDTVSNLNRQFQGNLNSSRYFTMIYGVIEVSTGMVTMTQAGHPAAVHLPVKSGEPIALGDGGMPVGMLEEASYSPISCQLAVGDRLFLYSDGMLECQNDDGEFYGSERLLKRIGEWKDLPIEELGDLFDGEISNWNGTEAFDDDVSMVILEFTGKR